MEGSTPYTSEIIDAEYRRLGHNLGWRFLTCPAKNIASAKIALITLNPGGSVYEAPLFSVETGSAYVTERWKNFPPGEEKLQRQIKRMFEIMGVRPEDALSGYLVPFRSRNWADLAEKKLSLKFGAQLWKNLLRDSSPEKVIAFGKDIADEVSDILQAKLHRETLAGWGDQTIAVYRYNNVGRLLVLPHLSRFSLFYRAVSERAFADALWTDFDDAPLFAPHRP
jgi:hypothetical protein